MSEDFGIVWKLPIARWIPTLVERHADLWADKSEEYWLMRLMSELGELAAALANDHEHPWQLEAAQVAAIATNMLKHKGLDV